MAIGNAVQRGSQIYVYDEKGRQLFIQSGTLHGFTSGTVVVRSGNMLRTYNERGSQTATTSA